MHFVILKENLSKVLSISGRFLSTKTQLPILSCILIKADKNGLYVSATNLEMGVFINIGAKIEKEGEVAIPGKLLLEFVSTLNTEKIECIKTDNTFLVKSGKTQATFATINPSDFPPFPQVPKPQQTFRKECQACLVSP